MRYVLSGQTFTIQDLKPELDLLFPRLHAAYLGGSPFLWKTIHEEAEIYLTQTSPRSTQHNTYFNNFTIVWNYLLASSRFDEAELLWEMALLPALNVERVTPTFQIHKGTAFYYWGITAILRGDIDKGYSLMHQAVEEDAVTAKTPFPHTPAFSLATLDWQNVNQYFRPWVVNQAIFLDKKLVNYAKKYTRPTFTLEIFTNKFLASPPDTYIVFLFAYTLARLMKIETTPEYTTKSRFVAQLFLNLFSGITLTIESALRQKNPPGKSFIDHAEFISVKAGCPISNDKLREINLAFNDNFDGTVTDIIENRFLLKDGTTLVGMQVDIAIAYGIRNKGAHDVSPTIVAVKFKEIMQALLNVMFISVDFAY